MKNARLLSSLLLLIFASDLVVAQPKKYSAANAHSHNDYLNKNPFYAAYNTGFSSVEADVFPVNGRLLVAHSKKEIKPEATLKQLYIDALANELVKNPHRRIKLLVDIKDNYKESLDLLIKEIEPLKSYIARPGEIKPLTILITGARPGPSQYVLYPVYLQFDDDLKWPHTAEEWNRVGQVSLSFGRYSTWKGERKPVRTDIRKLEQVVDSVHQAGKTIRFWAAPDNVRSWKLQKKLGVDLIGTDKVEQLGAFLKE